MQSLSNLVSQEFKNKTVYYQDSLHKSLVLRLQDPSLALRIYQAFQKHIAPLLQTEEREIFQKALLISSILPGSKKALTKTLHDVGFEEAVWIQKNKKAFKTFLSESIPPIVLPPKNTLFKVCIVTTSASGGNHSVAKAVAKFLNSQQNVCAEIIDVETVATNDLLKQAIGITYDGIYEHFYQKQGCDLNVLNERDTLTEELANHSEPKTLAALKEKIAELAPDLLITTRNYKEDDLSLAASLNIPTKMLYCDYDICMFHHHLIGKTDPNLIKFWFPALKPECFKSLFTHHKSEKMYDANDTWEDTTKKIATMTNTPIEDIMASFEEIGFPVNEEFTPNTNSSNLKEKYGFETDEQVILVSMGKNGVSELENVFSNLAKCEKHSLKVRYVFVCGTNDSLKCRLEKRLQEENLSGTALQRTTIYGHVSLQEMAELMNLSKLSIGKPGGASSSEHRALGLPMFVTFSHEFWESGNEREMLREGLIERHNPNKPLQLQLEECLLKQQPQKPTLIDWKSRILKELKLSSNH